MAIAGNHYDLDPMRTKFADCLRGGLLDWISNADETGIASVYGDVNDGIGARPHLRFFGRHCRIADCGVAAKRWAAHCDLPSFDIARNTLTSDRAEIRDGKQ